ncbi:hypothetical protein [Alkalihalobacillus hemicellulosilyticus]|nr:hypothetical protein [Halalkalibacter hemicellulosilyticus]
MKQYKPVVINRGNKKKSSHLTQKQDATIRPVKRAGCCLKAKR